MKVLSELDWTLLANVEIIIIKKNNESLNVLHINPHVNNP